MDSLPSAILIHIFGYLSYSDLKSRIPRVCQRYKSIIDDTGKSKVRTTALDRALFRDTPVLETDGSHKFYKSYDLHPAFSLLRLPSSLDGPLEAPITALHLVLRSPITGKDFPFGYEIAWENAVSPAVTEVSVNLAGEISAITRHGPESRGVDLINIVSCATPHSTRVADWAGWEGIHVARIEIEAHGGPTLVIS